MLCATLLGTCVNREASTHAQIRWENIGKRLLKSMEILQHIAGSRSLHELSCVSMCFGDYTGDAAPLNVRFEERAWGES